MIILARYICLIAVLILSLGILAFAKKAERTFSDNGSKQPSTFEQVADNKSWKKLIKSRSNVLVAFSRGATLPSKLLAVLRQANDQVRGEGSIVHIACTNRDHKALCKKAGIVEAEKGSPDKSKEQEKQPAKDYALYHYPRGDSAAQPYTRQETVRAIVSFLRDPNSPSSYNDDDPNADALVQVGDSGQLGELLKNSPIPVLLMLFSGAVCTTSCKVTFPEFAAAAAAARSQAMFTQVDVDRPENAAIRRALPVAERPDPTFLYFVEGEVKSHFTGVRKRAEFLEFLKNPIPPKPEQPEGAQGEGEASGEKKAPEIEWGAVDETRVEVLTEDALGQLLDNAKAGAEKAQAEGGVPPRAASLLLMVYAPWCTYCKQLQPAFVEAAQTLAQENVQCLLAALDGSHASEFTTQMKISGFPTLLYFKDGEHQGNIPYRTAKEMVDFMKDPKKPIEAEKSDDISWLDDTSTVALTNDSTFHSTLKRKRHAIVMFYAPWCQYCKKAKPDYVKAAAFFRQLAANTQDAAASSAASRVLFAHVDCTDATLQSVCLSESVESYPTIRYYNYGKFQALHDPSVYQRDFPGLMRFVMDRAAESGDDLKLDSHLLKLMSAESELGEQMRHAAEALPAPEAGAHSEPVPPQKTEL